jgi:transposase
MDATTIAVDLAKHVFEVAIEDARGQVSRRRLTRQQFARFLRDHTPAQLVMEACGSAHYWGRTAQAYGHRVQLLPPQYVRPFVRRQKTDRTDVTGLLDARQRSEMPTVAVKTVAQQEVLALHRVRAQWMATRTARINTLHGLLAEHGVTFAAGVRQLGRRAGQLLADPDTPIPLSLRRALLTLLEEIRDLERRAEAVERELRAVAHSDPAMERLQSIPGVGLLTATALVGSVGQIHGFKRARRFASWLGLTPREYSSGSHRSLGHITKAGDGYLRRLLVHGARAVLAAARRRAASQRPLGALQHWAVQLAERRGPNRATVALANKLARIVWAVWTRDQVFTGRPIAA